MGDHIVSLGKSLGTSVLRFNDFVGSLETSVLPQARKFRDLEVEGTGKELEQIEPIEGDIREPRKDRDMKFIEKNKGDDPEQ